MNFFLRYIALSFLFFSLGCGSGLNTGTRSASSATVTGTAILSISDGSSSSSADVGTVFTGGLATKTLTLTNSGTGPATELSSASLQSTNYFNYLGGSFPGTGGTCTAQLAAGSSCTIVIGFSPVVTGAHSNAIRVQFNDGSTSKNLDFSFSGTSVGGGLDTAFGTDGLASRAVGTANSASGAQAVVIQSDGRYVVAGSSYNGTDYDFALLRYLSDGNLDTTYSNDGVAILDNGGDTDNVYDLLMLTNGKFVVAGSTLDATYSFLVARYSSDGSIDTTFSADGKAVFAVNGTSSARCLAVQTDGRIVVAGHSGGEMGIARLLTNGTMDTTFSNDGELTLNPSVFSVEEANDVAINGDGRILLGAVNRGDNETYIARLNTDGSLDTTFSSDGVVQKETGLIGEHVTSFIIYSDASFLAGGNGAGFTDWFVLRYFSDGSLDTAFATNGQLLHDFDGREDLLKEMLLDSQSRLLLIGSSDDSSGVERFAMVRMSSTGVLDTSFGTNGAVTISQTGNGDQLNGAVLDSSGKLINVGSIADGSGNREFTIGRFFP